MTMPSPSPSRCSHRMSPDLSLHHLYPADTYIIITHHEKFREQGAWVLFKTALEPAVFGIDVARQHDVT